MFVAVTCVVPCFRTEVVTADLGLGSRCADLQILAGRVGLASVYNRGSAALRPSLSLLPNHPPRGQ